MNKLGALTIAVASLGCRGIDAPPPATASTPFLVSTPHPDSVLAERGQSRGDIAWVALPTGAISNAHDVSINVASSNQTITVIASNGGLDPVPVSAVLGDELRLRVIKGGGDVASFDFRIRGSKGPVVIRTSPPPNKRDVALNATIVIVFSEPLSPASLTAEAVTLTSGGTPVAGQLSFADSTHLIAVFTPTAPLTPSTDYVLRIAQSITNVDGQPLRESVVVPFTTTGPSAESEGAFTVVATMIVPREGHTATLLPDGKVLIAGGGTAGAELFDPSTSRFVLTGSMTRPRADHSATLLPNGKVLIAGGEMDLSSDAAGRPSGTAELYDPGTGTFAPTGVMPDVEHSQRATLLPNGRVLITSGVSGWGDGCCEETEPELYDPSTESFTLAGNYANIGDTLPFRVTMDASATLLHDGRVLVASEPEAELYDPALSKFSLAASMLVTSGFPTYWQHSIVGRSGTLLPDGRVLVVGGLEANLGRVSAAELYDPMRDVFSYTGSMAAPREGHSATLLNDGRVLVAGGVVGPCGGQTACVFWSSASAEIYDPAAGTFASAGALNFARKGHTATLLKDGRVLIAGGYLSLGGEYQGGTPILEAELYVPNGASNRRVRP